MSDKYYVVWDTETNTMWPGGKANKFIWRRRADAANAWNAHMSHYHYDSNRKLVHDPRYTEQTRYVTREVEIVPK